jgi:hypothetical protein
MHNGAPALWRAAEISGEKHDVSVIFRSALQQFPVTCVIFVILDAATERFCVVPEAVRDF